MIDFQDLANFHREQALLGGMLMRPTAIENAVHGSLAPEDFTNSAHRAVCAVILDLHHSGETVDPVTVAHGLNLRGQLAGMGGAGYMVELTQRFMAEQMVVDPGNAAWSSAASALRPLP